MGTMYDASTLMTLSETMALKAVEEPMLMSASSRLMTTVTAMEFSGKAERGSTYCRKDEEQIRSNEGTHETLLWTFIPLRASGIQEVHYHEQKPMSYVKPWR